MTRLHIAYLFQNISMDFTRPEAPQVHIYHIVRGLHRADHAVCLLALQGRQTLFAADGDLEWFGRRGLSEARLGRLGVSGSSWFKFLESGVRRVQSELKLPYLAIFDTYRMYDACLKNLRGCELIHERFHSLALGGTLASRKLNAPLVLEVNADLLEERRFQGIGERWLRQRFAVWATRLSFRRARAIICVSDQLEKHLAQRWCVDPGKMTVLPNAADVEIFGLEYDTRQLRDSLDLSTAPVVMFVGGFYPWHDLALLLDSFVQVLARVPSARLLLVGDGNTRSDIEQRIVQQGLEHAVVMMGSVEHSRVPELLAIADVVVAPNVAFFPGHGGSPLKLFEYMAAGKAIAATRTGQVAQIIRDGDNGVLVEPGDVTGFANAIVALLTRPLERKRLGRNARRQAVMQHSWERYIERLEEIYMNVLER